MKVLKFGGTSVGTVESLNNVKKIVEEIPGQAIIVVSALGGLTDKLIATAKMASDSNPDWKQEMETIRQRHYNIIENVVPDHLKDQVKEKIDSLLTGLQRNYEGVWLLRSLPEATLDIIVSFGERMSSVIVAAMVKNGKRYYSPDFVKTEKWYGKNIADSKLTDKLIKETFKDLEANEKAIVPGFISTDSTSGAITNLGRGGSDFTGALIAAALDAEVLEIWTDVDGFMTADPRIVKDALIIDHLTFTESMELCTFGAKVIYPPTIFPVFHKNIPIKILNTFNPKAPGTLVTDHARRDDLEIKGVTSLKDISVISLEINSQKPEPDFLKRALNIVSKQGVRIIPVDNPDPAAKICITVASPDAAVSLEMIRQEFAPEIHSGKIKEPEVKHNLVALAIVGKNMKSKNRLAARLRHSLERQGITPVAASADSDTTLLFIIEQEKNSTALPLIHSLVF